MLLRKKFPQLVALIIALFVASVIISISIPANSENQVLSRTSIAKVPAALNPSGFVMAVDVSINNGRMVSERDIIEGKAPILVLIWHDSKNQLMVTPLTSMRELAVLDIRRDQTISLADPYFSRLAFAYFLPDKKVRVIPLPQAGVRALFLDKNMLRKEELQKLEFVDADASLLMADNTQRPFGVISVETNLRKILEVAATDGHIS